MNLRIDKSQQLYITVAKGAYKGTIVSAHFDKQHPNPIQVAEAKINQ